MIQSEKVLILLDADVVIHLFKAERISLLDELYSGRLSRAVTPEILYHSEFYRSNNPKNSVCFRDRSIKVKFNFKDALSKL